MTWPPLYSTAGQRDAEDIGPVVATAGGIDPWRAAELAHHDDQCFVQHAAIGEVLDE